MPNPTNVVVSTQHNGDVAVVRLAGDLDSRNAAAIQAALDGVVHGASLVLLDTSSVDYMGSRWLRILLLLYRQAQGRGVRVAVVGLSDKLRALMAATGFLRFFAIADSVEDGLRVLGDKELR